MKYRLAGLVLTLLLSFAARAESIDIGEEIPGAIGQYSMILQEKDSRLDLSEAVQAYAQGRFSASTDPVMSFSIGSKPVWIRFDVLNDSRVPVNRRLSVETSWLDNIDIYFNGQTPQPEHHTMGDALPFAERPIDNRFFMVDHVFAPGLTTVYMRVATPDPLVIPVYLKSIEAMHTRELWAGYHYGLVYGAMLALMFYNLLLFLGIRSRRYLFYAIYLAFFLIMNVSYTGQGFKWLWSNYPTIQLWGNPVLMVAYAISGLLFATSFLDTRASLPRLHALTIRGCQGFAIALLLAAFFQQQALALLVAFSFVVLFSVAMVLLGITSFASGNRSARYFIYASVIAAIAAAITALAVWGLIPYNTYTYHVIEIGMLFEAVLLALALAHQFRLTQAEKTHAEQVARIDALTGLNNRRSFSELVEPMWHMGVRKNQDMALIILDVDAFKSINDDFGHVEGDKVLTHIARALARSARAGDILARWGGEEFILFMSGASLDEAILVAERMREEIAALHFEQAGKTLAITASFGVAGYNDELNTLDRLIAAADNHLYQAKSSGRNRVWPCISNRNLQPAIQT